MSNYQKILESKYVLAEIQKELNELKKLQPTEANGRRIVELEKRFKQVRISIDLMKRSYGFAA